jgi:hypothetical protein
LDGETLVYDTERNEAHALTGAGAAEFLAAADDVSRRQVLRKLALAGVAAAGTGALVKTIVAPTAAQAQSACGSGPACTGGTTCCAPVSSSCCITDITGFGCCPAGSAADCGFSSGLQCLIDIVCCSGTCNIPQGEVFGTCA